MDLIQQLRTVLDFLEREPRILKADANSKAVTAFTKSVASMHAIVKAEMRAAHPDYRALRQAIGDASQTMDAHWFSEKKKRYGVKGGKGKDENQLLAIAAFEAGDARVLLKDIRKSPEMRYQEELVSLAQLHPAAAVDRAMKTYKKERLEAFFKANELRVIMKKSSKGKSSFDSLKMKAALLEKLTRLHGRT